MDELACNKKRPRTAKTRPKLPSIGHFKSQLEKIKRLRRENSKLTLRKFLIDFDSEVEARCKQMQYDGNFLILSILHIQLPSALLSMKLKELYSKYNGDIELALLNYKSNESSQLIVSQDETTTQKASSPLDMDIPHPSQIPPQDVISCGVLPRKYSQQLANLFDQYRLSKDQKLSFIQSLKEQIGLLEKNIVHQQ